MARQVVQVVQKCEEASETQHLGVQPLKLEILLFDSPIFLTNRSFRMSIDPSA